MKKSTSARLLAHGIWTVGEQGESLSRGLTLTRSSARSIPSTSPWKNLCLLQQFTGRVYVMGDVQVARSDFMQHRSEQKEVSAINQRDFDLRLARQWSFQ